VGGGGSDLFNPRDGQDLIRGGTGRDAVAYWEADGIRVNLRTGVAKGWGRDSLHSVEQVVGTLLDDVIIGDEGPDFLEGGFGDDLLVGGAGRDRLLGDAGDDTLDGSRGDDELAGNDGFDRVDYGRSDGPVTVDLVTGEATGDGSDMLVGVEHLIGSPYDDSLTGDSNANAISGGEGNDIMSGEEGDDSLMGDAGDDHLDGGQDTDTLDGGVGTDVCVNGEALLDCES
jgi:Ca2+-binding RTX toxin-like protein